MSPAAGTLITVAPTGAETAKADVPALPTTLDELVETAVRCEAAGAALVHVHIRDDDHRPTLDLVRLSETVAALRAETSLVVQLSTGGSVHDPYEQRLRVLEAAPDSCSLTMGTVNFGDDVFLNPWPFVTELYQLTQQLEVVPEFELFDLGHVAALNRLLDIAGLPYGGRVHCDLVMGVPGGMPGTAAALVRRFRRCLGRSPRGRRPVSAGAPFRLCWPRCRRVVTSASGWRTPSATPEVVPSGTTPSWSSAPPSWRRWLSGRR